MDKDTAKLAVRLDEFLDAIDVGDTKLARFIVKKAVKKYPRHGLSFAMQGLAAVYIDNNHCFSVFDNDVSTTFQPDMTFHGFCYLIVNFIMREQGSFAAI